MVKQNLIIICIIFFKGFAVNAQTQYTYYFDNDINLVKKSRAVFEGVGIYENGLFELKVFDKRSKKLLLLQYFTDSSLQVSNGLFVNFLENGNKEWEGNYLAGKQDGVWKKWDREGQLLDSSLFSNGEKISENIYSYYPDKKIMSEDVYSSKDHKMKSTYYDEKGNIITPNFKEDPDIVFIKTEVEASFPGGDIAWKKYISDKLKSSKAFGSCSVRFIIHKDSSISNLQIVSSTASKIEKIIREAILSGPKWVPAKQNGRNVTAYKTISVEFERPESSNHTLD